jgi:hypothetical protein
MWQEEMGLEDCIDVDAYIFRTKMCCIVSSNPLLVVLIMCTKNMCMKK